MSARFLECDELPELNGRLFTPEPDPMDSFTFAPSRGIWVVCNDCGEGRFVDIDEEITPKQWALAHRLDCESEIADVGEPQLDFGRFDKWVEYRDVGGAG